MASEFVIDRAKFTQAFALVRSTSQQKIADLLLGLTAYLNGKVGSEETQLHNDLNRAKLNYDMLAAHIDQQVSEARGRASADQAPVIGRQQEIGRVLQSAAATDSMVGTAADALINGTRILISDAKALSRRIDILQDQKKQAERWVRSKARAMTDFTERKQTVIANRELAQGALDLISAIEASGIGLDTARAYDLERLYRLLNPGVGG